MSKLEKFIRKNFNLTEEDLKEMPRILARCDQEIEDSGEGQLSEYALYDIIDNELLEIENDREKSKMKQFHSVA